MLSKQDMCLRSLSNFCGKFRCLRLLGIPCLEAGGMGVFQNGVPPKLGFGVLLVFFLNVRLLNPWKNPVFNPPVGWGKGATICCHGSSFFGWNPFVCWCSKGIQKGRKAIISEVPIQAHIQSDCELDYCFLFLNHDFDVSNISNQHLTLDGNQFH